MRIRLAHLNDQGIDFAIFDADASSKTDEGRASVLANLTESARRSGLRVQKSVLAFVVNGRTTFYGSPDLVTYLVETGGVPRWTHTIDVP